MVGEVVPGILSLYLKALHEAPRTDASPRRRTLV